MSESSNEDSKNKDEIKFSIKLKESLDSSNNSENEDEMFFSTNLLLSHSNVVKTMPNQSSKKGKIFESIDLDIKKKLFSSEIGQKSDNKKSSEAISTEPTSLKVRNYKSPRKRFSVIKLIEKGKRSKKDVSIFTKKKDEKEISPEKKERTDIYGNVICKKNKKRIKVSFVDKVTSQPLVNIVEIESFKNYNYIYGFPKEEKIEKSSNCQCCFIF